MKKIEVLAPAGSYESLVAAVNAGADAVYMGGSKFGARAYADNPDEDMFLKGLSYAHHHGVKVYMTVNTLLKEKEIEGLVEYIKPYYESGLDAVIVQDLGVFSLVRKHFPDMEIHISTQMSLMGEQEVLQFYKLGASRVVPARELSLEEIKCIRRQIPDELEIETFIHGAMCMAYSGRCLLSNYFTGRDANQGACTHPCRWKYSVVEEKRPGEYMPVYEDENGTYIFNSKDLCMIEYIPELIEAGIDSFKIEGRMKTALYVATVARTYRKAIDDYLKDEKIYRANMEWYKSEIGKCTYREFTTGFFFGKANETTQIYNSNTYVQNYIYLGTVLEKDGALAKIEQKNKFLTGDVVELMKKNGDNIMVEVMSIRDEEGNLQDSAPHPRQSLFIEFDADKAELGDVIRIKKQEPIEVPKEDMSDCCVCTNN